ncbi:MAG TPA: gluconate 2-dehydrogenase subunit 3 family protein [Candidatus Salinicoccus stercoripullorum]|uniref:Gluconate 2-dehydrogenase subunit 3 family protein n=1 Tax=Candidatus Salinicoccus stercoripullorum TaxID=2838756 RepID=A0A9D1QH14_9STAP|nr:gluconate 2-dehydrogenase subunit 3 family protein [Candidatus Salinicoccus stercoripullorum]
MSENNHEKEKSFSRRDFLKNSGLVVGGLAGGTLLGGLATDSFISDQSSNQAGKDTESEQTEKPVAEDSADRTKALMFFTNPADFAVLVAATELIFPEDYNGPSAKGLHVPYYIDKQMAGAWGVNGTDYRQGPFNQDENIKSESKIYHARQNRGDVFIEGLRKMNEESMNRFDVNFDEASKEQQGEVMSSLEKGDIELTSIDSDGFFSGIETGNYGRCLQ